MKREEAIYKALKVLGVPANLLGYIYLQDAANYVLEDPSIMHRMTTELYPAIAAKHGSTSSRVERAMRHAVGYACTNTDPGVMHRCFGNVMNYRKGHLNNSQFIAGMVEYIKMEVEV